MGTGASVKQWRRCAHLLSPDQVQAQRSQHSQIGSFSVVHAPVPAMTPEVDIPSGSSATVVSNWNHLSRWFVAGIVVLSYWLYSSLLIFSLMTGLYIYIYIYICIYILIYIYIYDVCVLCQYKGPEGRYIMLCDC